ncbi:MAG: CsbD family protein [Thermoanaerobaculia bacterium]
MNQSTLKGKWNEFRGSVQERWGKITDDDLDVIEGRRDQLIGKIQQAYGRTRAEVERELEAWEKENGLR